MGASTFADQLVACATRKLQEGAAGVGQVASALSDYAALLPSSASNPEVGVFDGDDGTSFGTVAETVASMLASKQDATVVTGCSLLVALVQACASQQFLRHQNAWCQQLTSLMQRHDQQQQQQQQQAENEDAAGAAGAAASASGAEAWLAAAAALRAVYSRLAALLDAPGVRRGAAGTTSKIMPVLAPALAPGAPSDRQRAALLLLGSVLHATPHALRSQARQVEKVAAEALASPAAAAGVRAAAARAFGLTPRVAGTPESWGAAAQQLLWAANLSLDTALSELDAAGAAQAARDALDPSAADAALPAAVRSWSAGGGSGSSGSQQQQQQSMQLYALCINTLSASMTAPFAAPAPLPVNGVLALVARVQAMAAVSEVGTGHSQHSLAKRLALLSAAGSAWAPALALLRALMQALGGALLQHARPMSDIVRRGLRTVAAQGAPGARPHLPSEAELYAAARCLLYRGGPAAAMWLAQDALDAALWRLYGISTAADAGPGVGGKRGAGAGAGQPPLSKKQRRKRQQQAVEEAQQAFHGSAFLGSALGPLHRRLDCDVLGVLEALLTSGAALLPSPLRLRIDAVVAHSAASAAAAAERLERSEGGDAGDAAALQLAAYRALLASVLAPLGHRPPFLGEALALFRGGLHSRHEPVMAFCRQAQLYCEALLHPRAVPTPIPLSAANPASADEVGRVPAFAAALFNDVAAAAMAARHGGAGTAAVGDDDDGMEEDVQPSHAPMQQQQQQQFVMGQVVWGQPVTAAAAAVPPPTAPLDAAPNTAAQAPPFLQQQLQPPFGAPAAVPQPLQQGAAAAAAAAAPAATAAAPAAAVPPIHRPALQTLPDAAAVPPAAALPQLPIGQPAQAPSHRDAGAAVAVPAAASAAAAAAADVPMREAAGGGGAFGDESDDSEGPLPEIDSGASSDEDGEE